MSEPTYRVEIEHDPAEIRGLAWSARLYHVGEDEQIGATQWGPSRESVADKASELARRLTEGPHSPSTHYLTEDGDILDPHAAAMQRLIERRRQS